MEELERKKITKNKRMTALTAPHVRALVDLANEIQVQKADIVTILDRGEDGVVLIYYK